MRSCDVDLVCPKCAAMNRKGATIIERQEKSTRAFCMQCSHEGPIEEFQPEGSH